MLLKTNLEILQLPLHFSLRFHLWVWEAWINREVDNAKGAEELQLSLLWQTALPLRTDSSKWENWAAYLISLKDNHMLSPTSLPTFTNKVIIMRCLENTKHGKSAAPDLWTFSLFGFPYLIFILYILCKINTWNNHGRSQRFTTSNIKSEQVTLKVATFNLKILLNCLPANPEWHL